MDVRIAFVFLVTVLVVDDKEIYNISWHVKIGPILFTSDNLALVGIIVLRRRVRSRTVGSVVACTSGSFIIGCI